MEKKHSLLGSSSGVLLALFIVGVVGGMMGVIAAIVVGFVYLFANSRGQAVSGPQVQEGRPSSSPVVFIIGAILLVAIFGSSILYLGVFNLSPAASIGAAESKGGLANSLSYSDGGPTYHVYNFFNNGILAMMLLFGAIIALMMIDRLYQRTSSLLASIFYILGTLLLFSGSTIFLFGVHDLLTFTGPGETHLKPTVMQQYGWIIESVVFCVLGTAFVYSAEHIRKSEEGSETLAHLAIAPVASLMALLAIPIFIFGLHGTLYPGYNGATFTWVIETLLFGAGAALLFGKIDAMREEEKEKGNWKDYPLTAAGYCLLAAATFLFLAGTVDYLHNNHATDTWKFFVEVIVFAPLGFGAFFVLDRLNRKHVDYRSSLPGALAPIGAVLLLAATGALIFGFSSFIRADLTASNYRQSFAWVVDVLLFGIIGYTALLLSDGIKRKYPRWEGDLNLVLPGCGVILWAAALFFYFIGVHSFVYDSKPETKFLLELVFYGAIGLGIIVYADAHRRKDGLGRVLPKTLSLSGGLLLLGALLAFFFDLHNFIYSNTPDARWVAKTAAYLVMGAALLFIGNSMEPVMPKKGGETKFGKEARLGEKAVTAKPEPPEKPFEEPKKKRLKQEVIHEE